MEVVTTLTGYDTKSGMGQRGPWTLHLFADSTGTKFQTFDGGLASRIGQMMHQTVRLVYDVEQRNGYPNNVIKAIELAPGVQPTQQPQQQTFNGAAAPQPSSDDSKRRWAASDVAAATLQAAVTLLGYLPEEQRTLQTLVAVFETLCRNVETGAEALIAYYQNGPSSSSQVPAAPVGSPVPTGAYAGDPGPEYPGY